ncbi:MAG: PapD-like protein [Monoraphidium minutum]|nr:MAG: PapD-like protein [Monoraphidium minutum]
MAEITPTELRFRFQINKQLPASISIHNPTGDRLAFKVKTTTPKKYVVRPSSGVVDPRTSANVQVIMQGQKEYPTDMATCKDKFLVQTEVLAPGEEIGADTFKKSEGTKLRVVIEGPPAPPSPVPEVNETEDDSAKSEKEGGAAAAATGLRSRVAAAGAAAGEPGDLASENKLLRKQLEQVRDERDQVKRRLAGGGGGGSGTATKTTSIASLLFIILAAVVAFYAGRHLDQIQELTGLKA